MEFNCSKEDLLYGVQVVQRAVSNKNTMPILSGIFLSCENNKLILRSTDLELGIECIIPVQVLSEGSIVLPSKYFSELVRRLPNAPINFKLNDEGNSVTIKYNSSQLTMNGLDPEEFPSFPSVNTEFALTVDPNILKKANKQVTIATALDDSRPIFTGVLMDFTEDNNLTMVTTDTHRLALKDIKVNMNGQENTLEQRVNIIVPARILSEVSKLVNEDDVLTVEIGDSNQIIFRFDKICVHSRLIEGQFPNYKQVIPGNFKTKVTIETKKFMESVERASLISFDDDMKKKSNNIKLSINSGKLIINSHSSEIGHIHEEIIVDMEGDELDISFNAKYLLDVLKVIDEEEINMGLTGSLSPCIIQPAKQKNFLYLILPVRSA
ncbi:DNA polymerase-3 subunit beta [Desulfitispora alkaliphila]|uniref:DNA polymerase III subunit beta n=1 Tax=Desulfitispora alkaliphila TaxID=622674 RepID=UPI003D1BF9C6